MSKITVLIYSSNLNLWFSRCNIWFVSFCKWFYNGHRSALSAQSPAMDHKRRISAQCINCVDSFPNLEMYPGQRPTQSAHLFPNAKGCSMWTSALGVCHSCPRRPMPVRQCSQCPWDKPGLVRQTRSAEPEADTVTCTPPYGVHNPVISGSPGPDMVKSVQNICVGQLMSHGETGNKIISRQNECVKPMLDFIKRQQV